MPTMKPKDLPVPIGALTGSLAKKSQAVIVAMSEERITPDECATIMQALSAQARIIEVDELEKRIASLEEQRT